MEIPNSVSPDKLLKALQTRHDYAGCNCVSCEKERRTLAYNLKIKSAAWEKEESAACCPEVSRKLQSDSTPTVQRNIDPGINSRIVIDTPAGTVGGNSFRDLEDAALAAYLQVFPPVRLKPVIFEPWIQAEENLKRKDNNENT